MKLPSFSRRRFVSAAVAAAALPLPTVAESACTLIPEQEQGPFYLADELIRFRIAEDRAGIPLRLKIVIMDSRSCTPLRDAAVDLWHCDAMGLYSGFTKTSLGPPPGDLNDFGGPGGPGGPPPEFDNHHGAPPDRNGAVEGSHPHGPPAMEASDKLTFLRGIQFTGADGAVTFETVFPGFYQGRTNHVHFKVRLDGHREGQTYAAGHTAHTGQLFFPEFWNLKLMALPPYSNHHIHRTAAGEDNVFNHQHGSAAVANLIQTNPQNLQQGLYAQLRVSVDPTATPPSVAIGPPPRG